jgi:hypothetical protein
MEPGAAFEKFSAKVKSEVFTKADRHLGLLLDNLQVEGVAKVTGTMVGVSELIDAFRSNEGTPVLPVFTEEVCKAFHLLVAGAIRCYGAALTTLSKTKPGYTSPRVAGAVGVWEYSQLVWRISQTKLLRLHLEALEDAGVLTPLVYQAEASAYAIANGISGWRDDFDEMEDAALRYMGLHSHLAGVKSMAQVYRKWIRMQASYFTAAHSLANFCALVPVATVPELSISLILLNPSVSPTPTWSEFEGFINQYGPTIGLPAEEVIRNLKGHITSCKLSKNTPSIFIKFSQIVKGAQKPEIVEVAHCEAAWVVLKLFYSQTANADGRLVDLLEVSPPPHDVFNLLIRYTAIG